MISNYYDSDFKKWPNKNSIDQKNFKNNLKLHKKI